MFPEYMKGCSMRVIYTTASPLVHEIRSAIYLVSNISLIFLFQKTEECWKRNIMTLTLEVLKP